MEPLNLLLVGCGMMGARHVRGLAELDRLMPGTIRLVAVCDIRSELSEKVAMEAEEILDFRPKEFKYVEEALDADLDLNAVDVVTDPRSHDPLVILLLEAGLHVICEKPLSLTVTRGICMVEAADRSGRVLATAENNRRAPMNRLSKSCMDAGLIGEINFLLEISSNPGGKISGTTWRHRLAMGGVLFDVGIHTGYVLEEVLGPVKSVNSQMQIIQSHIIGNEFNGKKVNVSVDSEDCFSTLMEFESGAQGHWTLHFASQGETLFKRLIFGSEGTINMPKDRSGITVKLQRGSEILEGDQLLEVLPNYHLNEIEARLFGERPTSFSFSGEETDRKLIAAEFADFVEAIHMGRAPESDGSVGLRSVALIYAIMESALLKHSVTVDDVLNGRLHAYQDKVEAAIL